MAKMRLEIGANIGALQAGLNQAKSAVKSFTGYFSGLGSQLVGALSAGALIGFAKSAVSSAEEVYDSSKKYELTTDQVQTLAYAARQSGTDFETVAKGFKKSASLIYDALNGSEEAKAKLHSLGVTLDELKGKSLYDQVGTLFDAIKQFKGIEKLALEKDMFGKSGTELGSFVNDWRSLTEEAEKSALIMDTESVKAAKAFTDEMNKLGTSIKSALVNSGLMSWLKEIGAEIDAIINRKKILDKGKAEGTITKAGFLEDARARQSERLSKLSGKDYRDAEAEGRANFNKTKENWWQLANGNGISNEDYKLYQQYGFDKGKETYSKPITNEQVKTALDKKNNPDVSRPAKATALEAVDNEKKVQDAIDKTIKKLNEKEDVLSKKGDNKRDAFIQESLNSALDSLPKDKSGKQMTATEAQINQIKESAGKIFDKQSAEDVSKSISDLQKKIDIQKMINEGKAKDAAIQEEINALEEKAGRKLDDNELKSASEKAGQLYDMTAEKVKPLQMEAPIISDSVRRMGGSIGSANNISYAKDQLTVQKSIESTVKELNNKADLQQVITWA